MGLASPCQDEHQPLRNVALELGGKARVLDGLLDERERLEQPAWAEPAAMGDESSLALEMWTRAERPHRLLAADPAGLSCGNAVQLGEMSPECRKCKRRLYSCGGEARKLAKRLLRFAAAHLVDEGLDRDFGAVAHDCVDVLMADPAPPRGEQSELGDLGARHGLIRAKPRRQMGPGLRIDAEARFVELLVDQVGDGALVSIARDRCGRGVSLNNLRKAELG